MAATKLQANWDAVAHGSTSVKKVTAVTFNQGGALLEFAADLDRFPTVLLNLMSKPAANLTTAAIATVMAIAPGTVASFMATHKDAAKQVGGDILYTLSNAVAETVTANGPFGQYGNATFSMRAFSSDGLTNPLAFTRA